MALILASGGEKKIAPTITLSKCVFNFSLDVSDFSNAKLVVTTVHPYVTNTISVDGTTYRTIAAGQTVSETINVDVSNASTLGISARAESGYETVDGRQFVITLS